MSRKPEDPAASAAAAPERSASALEFSRPVRILELERSRRFKGEATEAEREALARRFGLLALESLAYEAEIEPWRGGWRARGLVKAEAVQACVVSLEPVAETIEEPFERGWLPAKALAKLEPKPASESEIPIDPELDDPPELLGEEIDLGEVAAEVFGLALDPYPRAPGAPGEAGGVVYCAAPPGAEPIPEAEIHPFARLKTLKGDKGEPGEP